MNRAVKDQIKVRIPRLLELVEAVEDRTGHGEGLLVGADHGQAAEYDVEAGCFGGVVAFVVEVGFVDDLGDAPEDGVVEVVVAQDGFEAAVALVVAEFDAAHVERGGVGRRLGRVGDEDELGVRVDVAADEPGAGGAVDVDAGAGDPLHEGCSSGFGTGWARASTAALAWSRSAGGK